MGHVPHFRRDPLGFLTHCAREYGDFVPLRFLTQRVVLLGHPTFVEQVLVTQQQHFRKSPGLRRNRRLLGHGLLTSDGEFWRRQRRLMQPAFHRQRIRGYGEVMVDSATRLLDTWHDGDVRDVHQEMMRLTLDIVAKTLFGADVGDVAADVDASMEIAMQRFSERTRSLLFLLPDTLPTPGQRRFERAARRLDEIIFDLIARRRRSGEERDDLLSMLLSARDESGGQMSDQQVRDEAMTLFLAGHETTAIALSWTWYLLSHHPAVRDRLHDELNQVLAGRLPTAADVPQLRYTEAVVSEAMRLYPPAWIMTRQAMQDCEIGGRRVRKGTVLLMSQWVMHHDPRFFAEPDAFRPERWLDGSLEGLPRFAYFPFGGGPRLCIGNAFASMEATLLVSTVAQRFTLDTVPDHPVSLWPVVTLRPRHGIRMTLHQRLATSF